MNTSMEKAPLVCSQRLTLAVMTFLGTFFVYAERVNLSVAILCMVRTGDAFNTTASIGQDTETTGNDVTFNATSTWQVINSTDSNSKQNSSMTSYDLGEFDWDKSEQSFLLSMYFYGYLFTQIPSGWLSSRLGGRRVWGFCQFVSAICTLLTPVSARTHFYLACAVRFLHGFASGLTFPAISALLGRWTPPLDRSKIVAISFSGLPFGMIVSFAISGILCENGFDNGWGSIFYLWGISNLVWVVAWFYLIADSPGEDTRISTREKEYILNSIGKGVVKRKDRIPWVPILTSGPVWAIFIGDFGTAYTGHTLVTSLPMFLKEAFELDIKKTGILSSVPYITEFVTALIVGQVADEVIEKGWLNVKNTRKLFQSISCSGHVIAFCALIQLDSSGRYWAVVLLCVYTSLKSFNRGGCIANNLDIAPSYAGIITGVSYTISTVPGIIAPVIVGALTPNKTLEEWRLVFYVCVGVSVCCSILYVILADGELQSWAATGLDGFNMEKNYFIKDNSLDAMALTGNGKDLDIAKIS